MLVSIVQVRWATVPVVPFWRPWVAGVFRSPSLGGTDERTAVSLVDEACTSPSSLPGFPDLFPWQPLPPNIHGHLYFEVIQQKLPRSCQRGQRRIRAENGIQRGVRAHGTPGDRLRAAPRLCVRPRRSSKQRQRTCTMLRPSRFLPVVGTR